MPSSSPHKLDPVQEEEKKGEEGKEEEEENEEEGDEMEEKKEGKVTRTGTGETEKGNGWRGAYAQRENDRVPVQGLQFYSRRDWWQK